MASLKQVQSLARVSNRSLFPTAHGTAKSSRPVLSFIQRSHLSHYCCTAITRTSSCSASRRPQLPQARSNIYNSITSHQISTQTPKVSLALNKNSKDDDLMHDINTQLGISDTLDIIDESLADEKLKENSPWGFVIYRTSYGDEVAWKRWLTQYKQEIEDSMKYYKRPDLLQRHPFVVFDDQAKFDGATPNDDIRPHFRKWSQEELIRNWKEDPMSKEDFEELEKSSSSDPGPDYFLGARYNYCLFVDDICLESLDHMTTLGPVVKVLRKDWPWGDPNWGEEEGEEKKTEIHPDFEDGVTEDGEEDVGWMYLHLNEVVDSYMHYYEGDAWFDLYMRPPYMLFEYSLETAPGFWRRKKAVDPEL